MRTKSRYVYLIERSGCGDEPVWEPMFSFASDNIKKARQLLDEARYGYAKCDQEEFRIGKYYAK